MIRGPVPNPNFVRVQNPPHSAGSATNILYKMIACIWPLVLQQVPDGDFKCLPWSVMLTGNYCCASMMNLGRKTIDHEIKNTGQWQETNKFQTTSTVKWNKHFPHQFKIILLKLPVNHYFASWFRIPTPYCLLLFTTTSSVAKERQIIWLL